MCRMTVLLSALTASGFLLAGQAAAQAPPPGREPLPPRSVPRDLQHRDPLPPRSVPRDLRDRDPLPPQSVPRNPWDREPLPPKADPDSLAFPLPEPPLSAVPRAPARDLRNREPFGPAPVAPPLDEPARKQVAKLLLGLKDAATSALKVPAGNVVDVRKSGLLTDAEVDALAQALRKDVLAERGAIRLTRQLRERGLLGERQAVIGAADGKVYVFTTR
jgi:hypothetical protein